MKNGKVSWKSFMRWEKKIFKNNQKSGFMLRSVNNANSPIGPGSLTEDDFLYYIEAYCTVMGVYYWNFSNVLSYRVMMDEFWNLREKIYKFNKLRNDDEVFKKIKKAAFKDLGNVDEKELADETYVSDDDFVFSYRDCDYKKIFDKNKVDSYIKDNLPAIENYVKEQYGRAKKISFEDGIEFYERKAFVDFYQKNNDEICALSEEIGKMIFSPVYRKLTFDTKSGKEFPMSELSRIHNEEKIDENSYNEKIKEWEKMPKDKKVFNLRPFKYPAFLTWGD
jgi:hypothetical protein